MLQFGDVVATLQYSPFQLQLNRNKDVLLVLNGRSMFHFEHTREKKVIYTPHVQNFAQDLAIPDVFDVSGAMDAPMVLEITLITAAGIIFEQRSLTEAVGRTGWRPRRLVAGVFQDVHRFQAKRASGYFS